MSEEKIETVDESDVWLVMAQTQTTREIATYFLEKNRSDLMGAIVDIIEDQERVEIKEPDCT